ncbi:short chain dehydrogenase reductase [Botrytis cinerea]
MEPQISFPVQAGAAYTATIHHDTYPLVSAANCKEQKNRAVFITGASRGIGRACAVAFAQAGASAIAIGARSSLDPVEKAIFEEAAKAGHPAPKVLKLTLDVSDEKNVASAFAQTEQSFGRLDILVNNAGRLENWFPLADTDPTSWWRLGRGGQKTIININSIGAHLCRAGASAYQTGKLAICRLTEFTSVEYGGQGVVAIAVHPGAVDTELIKALPAQYHTNLVDAPELAADTIVWLTREKQGWLNGRYISANWDMEEIMSRKDEIVEGNKLRVRLVL